MDFRTNRDAREEADIYYFKKLVYDISEGFEVIREDDEYARQDCWIKNTESGILTPVELKGRDINLDTIKDEGVLIDLSKVKAVTDGGRGVICQFFPLNNKALVWVISKEDVLGLNIVDKYCRKNNVEKERVLKRMVMLQVQNAKVFDLDMHAYYKIVAFATSLV